MNARTQSETARKRPSNGRSTTEWEKRLRQYAAKKRSLVDSGQFTEEIHQQLIQKHRI